VAEIYLNDRARTLHGMMRLACVMLLLAGTLHAQGPRLGRGEVPAFPPERGTAQFISDLAPLPPNFHGEMLEYLVRASNLIIAATVESSSAHVNGRHVETDVVLRIDAVIKGTATASRVLVAQLGGTIGEYRELTKQYALMQPGERYILFLQDDRRNQLPPEPFDTRRYSITRLWEGTFRIDDEQKVRLAPAASAVMREKYEGMHIDEAMTHIRYWSMLN
jgi:hypothetical protein